MTCRVVQLSLSLSSLQEIACTNLKLLYLFTSPHPSFKKTSLSSTYLTLPNLLMPPSRPTTANSAQRLKRHETFEHRDSSPPPPRSELEDQGDRSRESALVVTLESISLQRDHHPADDDDLSIIRPSQSGCMRLVEPLRETDLQSSYAQEFSESKQMVRFLTCSHATTSIKSLSIPLSRSECQG